MSALVFMDTETTGLALTDDIWEFAGIRREEDGSQTELHLFIEHDEEKCRHLPESFLNDHLARFPGHDQATSRDKAARAIANFLSSGTLCIKPHIVGAVPNFDTERIARLIHRVNRSPEWHHHLIDVENLAVGYLYGAYKATDAHMDLGLPWDSDELSVALGVKPPTDARHTAMGDALWAMAIYDHVMGGK
jgi:hypothetical protein